MRANFNTVYLVASGQFSLAEVMVYLSARLSSSSESCVCIVTPLRGFRLAGFHPGLRFAAPWAIHLTPLRGSTALKPAVLGLPRISTSVPWDREGVKNAGDSQPRPLHSSILV